jgi:hypothetical protein
MGGQWSGLRTYLRPFRGVSKWYLAQYVAIFLWGHAIKRATDEFLSVLLGKSRAPARSHEATGACPARFGVVD